MKAEKIAWAAIRYPDGEIVENINHDSCVDTAVGSGRMYNDEYETGFLTTEGRFVDRRKAFDIAKASDSLRDPTQEPHRLLSYEVIMTWGKE